jgi:cupin fold WbuC family metalloprotein
MPDPQRIELLDESQISDLASEAETAPRRRTHLLLHSGPQDQVQRLMIVLQPGSYIRPHHHSQQWELLVLLQGRGNLLSFDGSGCLAGRVALSRSAQVAQIPAGVWHGFVVLENDTAVLEIKPGPYRPNEFANWAWKRARRTQGGWSNG